MLEVRTFFKSSPGVDPEGGGAGGHGPPQTVELLCYIMCFKKANVWGKYKRLFFWFSTFAINSSPPLQKS